MIATLEMIPKAKITLPVSSMLFLTSSSLARLISTSAITSTILLFNES
eukprot:CAMPEP_0184726442 /NCGR_PEP_ID=MMETSP0314-20130426/33782_1 /TAXON_ID=38298 /ORGANISM="Rhodella maculata, Strain CCMP 736" /LENGTH=47 /DNA_ID= /DNA_START= /DNA_END= /DNA_ORIENTATION=